MARPKKPLRERIEARSERIGDHLIWHGQIKKGLPFLNRIGNPARILLDLTNHPDYQIRKECDEPRCIDPHHYRVIREIKFKYDNEPHTPWRDPRNTTLADLTDREVIEIEETVELLNAGEIDLDEILIFPKHMQDEILRRCGQLRP